MAKQKPRELIMFFLQYGIIILNMTSVLYLDSSLALSIIFWGMACRGAYNCLNAKGHDRADCARTSINGEPLRTSLVIPIPITTEETAIGSKGSVRKAIAVMLLSFLFAVRRSRTAYTNPAKVQMQAVHNEIVQVFFNAE